MEKSKNLNVFMEINYLKVRFVFTSREGKILKKYNWDIWLIKLELFQRVISKSFKKNLKVIQVKTKISNSFFQIRKKLL